MKRWSPKEIAYLKAHRDQPYAKTARVLGRSVASVNGKYCMLAMELKVAPWSDKEIETLAEKARRGESDRSIARSLGRSANAVRQRRLLMGILRGGS